MESFGSAFPEQDGEVIIMAYQFFKKLGLTEFTLKLNSIGYSECRNSYRTALTEYLKPYFSDLSETSQKRFQSNPLRILDTKVPHEKEILNDAPNIANYLSTEDVTHFEEVQALLKTNNIQVVRDLLGHREISTTQIYTHVTQTQAKAIYMKAHPMAKNEVRLTKQK